MLYEVEVVADGNSPMDLNRVFDLLTDPRPALRIVAPDPMGNDVWCDVTGWENGRALPGNGRAVGGFGRGCHHADLRRRGRYPPQTGG